MKVILLQRVEKLGAMGDVVNVKDGYARNFLLPQGKALRASKDNVAYFEAQKAALSAQNDARRGEAEKLSGKMTGTKVVIIRQAAESGQLFGSVSARDIADAINAKGFNVTRQQVRLNHAIKALGILSVAVELHPEVIVSVGVNVARSEDEAQKQEQELNAPKAPAKKGKGKAAADDIDPSEQPQPDAEQPPEETEAA